MSKFSQSQERLSDCPKNSCLFPKTCQWNRKCMQIELELSLMEKKKNADKSPHFKATGSIRKKT